MTTPYATQAQHRGGQGTVCPVCRSESIEGREVETGEGEATQHMNCLACGASWVDGYTLTSYLIVNGPAGPQVDQSQSAEYQADQLLRYAQLERDTTAFRGAVRRWMNVRAHDLLKLLNWDDYCLEDLRVYHDGQVITFDEDGRVRDVENAVEVKS